MIIYAYNHGTVTTEKLLLVTRLWQKTYITVSYILTSNFCPPLIKFLDFSIFEQPRHVPATGPAVARP